MTQAHHPEQLSPARAAMLFIDNRTRQTLAVREDRMMIDPHEGRHPPATNIPACA